MTKKVIKETVEKIERYCDDCGSPAGHYCCLCGKDLCGHFQNKCAIQKEDDGGDYPDYCCKECWKIGETYRSKIDELNAEIWRLEEEWEKKAKENKKK